MSFIHSSIFINGFIAVCLLIFSFLVLVLRRLKLYPEKNYKHAALSILLEPVRFFRLGPYKGGKFSIKQTLASACKKVGLDDFGVEDESEDFRKNYTAVLESKEHQSQVYSNVGTIFARIELNQTFVRRLNFVKFMKEAPAFLNVPVTQPTFVMGLPRTGTTFLHRLLSLDPKVRAPLLWELLSPVPNVSANSSVEEFVRDREKRAKFIRKLIANRKAVGDDALAHIHEIGADLPEECLLSLSDDLPILPQLLVTNYMNYETFLTFSAKNAYLWYRKVLQLLSYQVGESSSPRNWMLKCPMHLLYVKEIANAFPDAKLIWTHRHPVSSIPSMASLLKAFHQVYYEEVGRDDKLLGKKVKEFSAIILQNATKDIKPSGLDHAHIIYNDLVKDPKAVVKSIYQQFSWDYTPEYDNILDRYLDENRKERESLKKVKKQDSTNLHTYTPEEFGLSENELCTGYFAEYISDYGIPMSKN